MPTADRFALGTQMAIVMTSNQELVMIYGNQLSRVTACHHLELHLHISPSFWPDRRGWYYMPCRASTVALQFRSTPYRRQWTKRTVITIIIHYFELATQYPSNYVPPYRLNSAKMSTANTKKGRLVSWGEWLPLLPNHFGIPGGFTSSNPTV